MTRVIAGRARGRPLRVPPRGTRPTSDRVRESLFASVESRLLGSGRTWADVAVCDAYAGSGAVAIEAWSRGCPRTVAIEQAKEAVRVIEANIASVGARGDVRVIANSAQTAFAKPPVDGPVDVMFLDPPYDVPAQAVSAAVQAAQRNGWLAPEAWVIIERSARAPESPFPVGASIGEVVQRRYGESVLWYGRVIADEGES